MLMLCESVVLTASSALIVRRLFLGVASFADAFP
jgi:hypothetical protein